MSGAYDRAATAQVPQHAPQEAPQPTPGKRALTDKMTRREAPAGKESALERAAARWMPTELRHQQEERAQNRIHFAHQNYKLALLGKRLELLFSHSSGWGFAAELVFGLVSYNATFALVGAFARLRKRAGRAIVEAEWRAAQGGDAALSMFYTIAERVSVERVRDTLSHLGRSVRSGIKEKTKHLAPHADSKQQLISLVHNEADHYSLALLDMLPLLDDDDLILLNEAYDTDAHTFETYVRAVDDLIARYESQGIESIGQPHGATEHRGRNAEPGLPTRLEAVRFVYGKRERVALVERVVGTEEKAPPVDAHSLPLCHWSHWVDEDLSGAAAGVYEHRVGSVMSIDVEAGEIPPAWAPQVSVWIAGVTP
jgi:hypothetical protein